MYVSRLGMQSVTLYRQTLLFIVLLGTAKRVYGFGNLATMNKIIGNLIRCDHVAQQEMIMGLNMNNVMDNNWVLICIWRVQLPFLWLSYFHAYQTTPTECTCARPTLRIRISSYNIQKASFLEVSRNPKQTAKLTSIGYLLCLLNYART